MKKTTQWLGMLVAIVPLIVTPSVWAGAAGEPERGIGPAMFASSPEMALLDKPIASETAVASRRGGQFFPSSWSQLDYNPQHNPVFSVPAQAPAYLQKGVFWADPLTGSEAARLLRAYPRYPIDGGQDWGSVVAQFLGNIPGVSAVDGMVYVEEDSNTVYALDAATGHIIWKMRTVNSGMGTPLVTTLNGRPVVFVSTGDIGFTWQNALKYANGGHPPGSSVRGANFTSIYALDGLTGHVLWRVDTQGEAMPTPVYLDGTVFANTGDGHLYAIDAKTGAVESSFPTAGISSMSSGNWYRPASGPWAGHLLIIFGTHDHNSLMAVDETHPGHPQLAWEYQVPAALNTNLEDISPALDPKTGTVITDTVIKEAGSTPAHPILSAEVIALDAGTGQVLWTQIMGRGVVASPASFKGSVPMIHQGTVYVGDLFDESYHAFNEATGAPLWTTSLAQGAGQVIQPRGGAVYYRDRLLVAAGRNIFTLNPATGAIDNTFGTPGVFAGWPIESPVIVGNEMYLASYSGWVFAVPATYVMTHSGSPASAYPKGVDVPTVQGPVYFDPGAAPTPSQVAAFPATWLAYAGNPEHNAYLPKGPAAASWKTGLNHALALNAPPRDQTIFGRRTATVMSALAFGVGTGVSPARGILYVGDGRYSDYAINATTGRVIWRFATMNNNFGQPLVTPHTVVISSGDPWFSFSATVYFATNNPKVHLGAGVESLVGLDPATGREKWTVYTRGTDMMTPLYANGNLYWVNGSGNVWGVNADTGKPLAPFEDTSGNPTLRLGGVNTIDSANVYQSAGGPAIMVVGTAHPSALYGIDLSTDKIVWTETLAGFTLAPQGFGDVSPAVDQAQGLVISDVLVNPSANGRASLEAYAVNPLTGSVVWTANLGTNTVPYGFTGSVPVYANGTVYLGDPLTRSEVAIDARTGAVLWQTPIGQVAEAPGVVVGSHLIVAAGPDLMTLDTANGSVSHVYQVGGAFVDNNPAVLGNTLYIGNSWGWAMALPLSKVMGLSS